MSKFCYHRNLPRPLPLALLALPFLLAFTSCSGYVRDVVRWNMFQPTPRFDPASQTVDRARLINVRPSWVRLGHATTLVSTTAGVVVTDPLLHERMHAFLGLGPRRITRLPAVDVKALPVRAIVVSHNHPDHYEPSSILKFDLRSVLVVLPPGIPAKDQERFRAAGARVKVLSWARGQARPAETTTGELRIRAFPVNHWGRRCFPSEECANGYAIEANGFRVAFFGDTAWRPHPDFDGKGFDVCLIPIGSNTYRNNHIGPAEAWQIHTDSRCRRSTPIHWDTFVDEPRPRYAASDEEWRRWIDEPLCGFILEAAAAGRTSEIGCTGIGIVCTLDAVGVDEGLIRRCRELKAGPRQRYRNQFHQSVPRSRRAW